MSLEKLFEKYNNVVTSSNTFSCLEQFIFLYSGRILGSKHLGIATSTNLMTVYKNALPCLSKHFNMKHFCNSMNDTLWWTGRMFPYKLKAEILSQSTPSFPIFPRLIEIKVTKWKMMEFPIVAPKKKKVISSYQLCATYSSMSVNLEIVNRNNCTVGRVRIDIVKYGLWNLRRTKGEKWRESKQFVFGRISWIFKCGKGQGTRSCCRNEGEEIYWK